MEVKPTLLPIDECEEWIWEILDYTKDSSFEYITDEGKIFWSSIPMISNADSKALYKIKKITGMRLAQFSTHNCYTQLWFCKSPLTNKNGSLVTTYTFDEASIEYSSLIVHSNLQCGCNIWKILWINSYSMVCLTVASSSSRSSCSNSRCSSSNRSVHPLELPV